MDTAKKVLTCEERAARAEIEEAWRSFLVTIKCEFMDNTYHRSNPRSYDDACEMLAWLWEAYVERYDPREQNAYEVPAIVAVVERGRRVRAAW